MPISAVVITKNEERCIERCLDSLSWADEILVVDAGSTDRTRELCEKSGTPWSDKIKLKTRDWTGFKDQRNFAIDQASHDWIFSIDADEKCSPELANKIKKLLSSDKAHPAYKVRRVEYFLGKPISHGIWNPSYQDRFFFKKGVRYINDVHEYPKFPTPPRVLEEPIHHFPNFSAEQFLNKMNHYTTIEAKDRIAQGMRTNPFRLFFAFPAMFLKNYFYYGAYKDGMSGFVISLLEATSRVVRHIKIWQYSKTTKAR